MNTFGTIFRLSIFGESHGPGVGVTLDGVPPGIALSERTFAEDLARRRGGSGPGTTSRREKDIPEFISGFFNGRTTGAPLTILFRNENVRSSDYAALAAHPRPSHSDWVAGKTYKGFNDLRGGGHFSGRLTLGLVAAGVVAKKILARRASKISIESYLTEIGGSTDPGKYEEIIKKAMAERDSVGGIVECTATGIPSGWGEPFFNSAESVISHLLFSVPAVKGVEFGAGFEAARLRGSVHNDPIVTPDGTTATNNAGGIVGGLTNGNPLVVRAAVKPTASISGAQETLNTDSGTVETLTVKGRHDACIALRAVVVVEAAVAIALCDLAMVARGRGL